MTTQMNDLEKFTLTVIEQDAHGAVVPFGGVPVWTSSDEGVATISGDPAMTSVTVLSVAPGSAVITVTVDGLSAVYHVSVIAAPHVLTLTASAPEPK